MNPRSVCNLLSQCQYLTTNIPRGTRDIRGSCNRIEKYRLAHLNKTRVAASSHNECLYVLVSIVSTSSRNSKSDFKF